MQAATKTFSGGTQKNRRRGCAERQAQKALNNNGATIEGPFRAGEKIAFEVLSNRTGGRGSRQKIGSNGAIGQMSSLSKRSTKSILPASNTVSRNYGTTRASTTHHNRSSA